MLEIFQRDWESCAPQDTDENTTAPQDAAAKDEGKNKRDEKKDKVKEAAEPVGAK